MCQPANTRVWPGSKAGLPASGCRSRLADKGGPARAAPRATEDSRVWHPGIGDMTPIPTASHCGLHSARLAAWRWAAPSLIPPSVARGGRSMGIPLESYKGAMGVPLVILLSGGARGPPSGACSSRAVAACERRSTGPPACEKECAVVGPHGVQDPLSSWPWPHSQTCSYRSDRGFGVANVRPAFPPGRGPQVALKLFAPTASR